MEEWEIKLREKYQNEIEEGLYPIGDKLVSKGHWIEFDIAMRKELKKVKEDSNYFYNTYFKIDAKNI